MVYPKAERGCFYENQHRDFNLNNLFSRYNFKGEIQPKDFKLNSKVEYKFTDEETYKVRTYMGKLVSGKPKVDTETIATRIKEMGVDVLAMQEVEDIDTLKEFTGITWTPCIRIKSLSKAMIRGSSMWDCSRNSPSVQSSPGRK